MQFTVIDARTRRTEVRRHVPFVITQSGPCEWVAHDPRSGRLIARGWISCERLQSDCERMTEHVRYVKA